MPDSKPPVKNPRPIPRQPTNPKGNPNLYDIGKAIDAQAQVTADDFNGVPAEIVDAPDDRHVDFGVAEGIAEEAAKRAVELAEKSGVTENPLDQIKKARMPLGWVVAVLVASAGTLFGAGVVYSQSKSDLSGAKAEATAAVASASSANKVAGDLLLRVDAGEKQGADHEARLRALEKTTTEVATKLETIEKRQVNQDKKLDQILMHVK